MYHVYSFPESVRRESTTDGRMPSWTVLDPTTEPAPPPTPPSLPPNAHWFFLHIQLYQLRMIRPIHFLRYSFPSHDFWAHSNSSHNHPKYQIVIFKFPRPGRRRQSRGPETPLLHDDTEIAAINAHEAVYSRFSNKTKHIIVALVSWSAVLPLFASGTFIPSIPQIAKDLNSDVQTITLTVSVAILCTAIGMMLFATYSAFYGRRAMYLCGTPLLFFGSMGVAFSRTVPEMIFWRCVQAMGTSGGTSVGGAVIGDIYKVTERGTAMGIFFGASLAGPALAPLAGGWGAHYASWRWTQICLGIAGLFTFVLLAIFLPETSHPGTRGLDKYRRAKGYDSNSEVFKWVWLNPFKCFRLLKSPNLLLTTLCGTVTLVTDFVLLVPIAYTIGQRYNITNELIIGACFIPAGFGNAVGAPISGRISDLYVIRAIEKYGKDHWRPEERLKGAIFGLLIPVPLSVLASGLVTTYVAGPIGLTLNLLCFFVNGVGVDLVLTPLAAYAVDIMRDQSAEVMAASMGLRSIILSLGITLVIPGIQTIGLAATDAIAAGISWLGLIIVIVVIKYGKHMREFVDMGYTGAKTN